MLRLTEPKIWRDPDFRKLDSECKLAWQWLIQNEACTTIGLTETTPEDFAHSTGMGWEVIERLTSGPLQRNVRVYQRSGTVGILLLNFCKYQWRGKQLCPTTKAGKGLCMNAMELPEDVRMAFLERYPNLQGTVTDLLNGVDRYRPLQTVSNGPGTVRYGTGTSSSLSFSEHPADEEVLEFSRAWPGEAASGTPPLDHSWVLVWLARMNSRSGAWPANWKRALIAAWRADWRGFTSARVNGVQKKNGRELWQVDQDMERLRSALAGHPVSRAAMGEELPPEVRQQWEALQATMTALKKERAALMEGSHD